MVGVARWDGFDAQEGVQLSPETNWQLSQCSSCAQPCLRALEDYSGDGDPEAIKVSTIFPALATLPPDIPAELRREITDAQRCLEHNLFAPCLVMVRRTLEGAMAEQGAKGKSLAAQLKQLTDDGGMDPMLFEWSTALRQIGNKGAPFSKEAVSREDAADALAFAEALLDHLFVLRRRFSEFQARLAAPKATST